MMVERENGLVQKQYRISIIKEVVRKSIHLCSAFTPFLIEKFFIPSILCLLLALSFYVISEFLRLEGIEIPGIARITQVAARKRDENKFVLGPVTLVTGIVLVSLVCKGDAARIGIFALAFGDGLASLTGKLFGRIRIPFTHGKTAAGSLACFCAVYISSFTVTHNTLQSLILAFTAMAAEVLPLTDFDNILIPLLLGTISTCLMGSDFRFNF